MADSNARASSSKQHDEQANTGRHEAEAVHQGTEAARQGAHAAGAAAHQAGDVGAEAARRGGEAGADAVRRDADVVAETWRRRAEDFAESQHEFAQQAAERFQKVRQKVAEAAYSNTENVRALMSLPHSAQGGLQDLQQGVVGLIEGVVRANLRATQELFQIANPGALVELQQRFARDHLDALMQGTATLVRATRRTADEALRPLEQQIEQRRRQQLAVNQGGRRYKHAAE